MNTEQKAQAYDKAIEKAKKIIKDYEERGLEEILFYAKEDLEGIFPELREPKDEFAGLTDFERTLADICIGWIGEEPGWKQYIKDNADVLLKIAIEKFNSVQDASFEQKSADKVEPKIENTRSLLSDFFNAEYERGKADALKSIEWSDEDEQHIDSLLKRLDGLCRNEFERTRFAISEDKDWLEFLKQRHVWKPTKEQMRALHDLNLTGNISYAGQGQSLIELYNDLKKL